MSTRMSWLVVIGCAACALTSKSPPVPLRYFTPPAPAQAQAAPHGAPAEDARRKPLRIGRVGASAMLGLRIVHRNSEVEVEPYETLRWTDEPEIFVRRAVTRALFEDRAIAQATDGASRALDVEIVGFEEVRRGDRRFGRVVLRYTLRDDKRVLARGTVAAEREAAGAGQGATGIDRVVAAIGTALDDVTQQLASRVADADAAG